MKYVFLLLLFITSIFADKVNREAIACPSVVSLQNVPTGEYMEINKYVIANNCVVVSPNDSFQVVSSNKKDAFVKISLQEKGLLLYIKSSLVKLEQPGDKNILKF